MYTKEVQNHAGNQQKLIDVRAAVCIRIGKLQLLPGRLVSAAGVSVASTSRIAKRHTNLEKSKMLSKLSS